MDSFVILVLIYLIFGDLTRLWQFALPKHLLSMVLMGGNYAFMHYFWYNAINKIDLTIATALIIPAPVITAIFAVLFLSETFYPFHLVGIIGTFVGLYGLLISQRKKRKEDK